MTPDTAPIRLHRLEHETGAGPYAVSQWPQAVAVSIDRHPYIGAQAFTCHKDPRYKETVPDDIHSDGWGEASSGTWQERNPWAYACPSAVLLCQWFGVPVSGGNDEWRYVVVEIDPEHVLVSEYGEQALYRVDRPHVRHEYPLTHLREAYYEETGTCHPRYVY